MFPDHYRYEQDCLFQSTLIECYELKKSKNKRLTYKELEYPVNIKISLTDEDMKRLHLSDEELLRMKIDKALEDGDKEKFLNLTEELNSLLVK